MVQLIDRPVAVTQDCPACDGVVPAEAITLGRSRSVMRRGYLYRRAKATLKCPHCGHTDSKYVEYPEG